MKSRAPVFPAAQGGSWVDRQAHAGDQHRGPGGPNPAGSGKPGRLPGDGRDADSSRSLCTVGKLKEFSDALATTRAATSSAPWCLVRRAEPPKILVNLRKRSRGRRADPACGTEVPSDWLLRDTGLLPRVTGTLGKETVVMAAQCNEHAKAQ